MTHTHSVISIFNNYIVNYMPRAKIFRFKQFSVINDKTAMKVGTDGVLLGAWCDVDMAQHVLDVGTGCGVIALMIAQRNAQAIIDGIDIDDDAVNEARSNFRNSPWSDRMTAITANFNDFLNDKKYDLIVSNPPFFTNGILPPNPQRNNARHTTTLSLSQLIMKSATLLSSHGSIAMITPVEAETIVKRCIVESNLWIKRLTQVIPIEGSTAKRLLWQITVDESTPSYDQLIIETTNRNYTSEYIALTRNFYLKM